MIRVRVLTLGRQPWLPCHMVSWGEKFDDHCIMIMMMIMIRHMCHNCIEPAHMSRGRGSEGVGEKMGERGTASTLKMHIISQSIQSCYHSAQQSRTCIYICICFWETPQYSCLYSRVWHFCQKFGIDERIQIWWADVFWRVHHLIGRHRLPPRPRWICFFRFSMQPSNSTGWGERLKGIVKTLQMSRVKDLFVLVFVFVFFYEFMYVFRSTDKTWGNRKNIDCRWAAESKSWQYVFMNEAAGLLLHCRRYLHLI